MKTVPSSRPVAIWILVGVGMLIIQALLGGITRLTGSGLSITEWKVVTGTIPPIGQQQWLTEFQHYQQTPQFRLLNTDFTLSDFKYIFFWEWFHRLWGRFIGVVFLIPFIIFLAQKRIREDMIIPLVILFLLGAAQGLVGWIMVLSGFEGDSIHVNAVKLTLHFLFAMVLIGYALWFGLQLLVPGQERKWDKGLLNWVKVLLPLVFLQLAFGSLMAGNKGATAAPTWPSINGSFVPPGIFQDSPWTRNLAYNTLTIHFIHRGLAYLIALVILIFTWNLYQRKRKGALTSLASKTYWIPLALVGTQVLLGIMTVLASPTIIVGHWGTFEWLAQFHQLVGIFLSLSILYISYLVSGKQSGKA